MALNPEKLKIQELYDGTEISRDDVIEAAGVALENDPRFPMPTGNLIKAKVTIRKIIEERGLSREFIEGLENQVTEDAQRLLELFK